MTRIPAIVALGLCSSFAVAAAFSGSPEPSAVKDSKDSCAQTCSSTCGASTTVAPGAMAEGRTIVETAVAAGSFNTLVTAVQAAGLVDALNGDGPFTVFAPTDDAFAKLPKHVTRDLLKPENKALLTSILTYHVVSGDVMAKDVVNRSSATSLNGQRIDITMKNGNVMVDGAKVVATDIACTNGVIHVIDTVILPKADDLLTTAASAGQFNTLAAAVKAAGLVEALSSDTPLTVFAPTDEAFAKLPKGTVENLLKHENLDQLKAILAYHVVPGRVYADDALKAQSAATLQGERVRLMLDGGQLTVNGANIVATDVETSNGVIHVIDSVLLPGQ